MMYVYDNGVLAKVHCGKEASSHRRGSKRQSQKLVAETLGSQVHSRRYLEGKRKKLKHTLVKCCIVRDAHFQKLFLSYGHF